MALELIESTPRFAHYMAECEEALVPYVDFSLRGVLEGAPGAPSIEPLEVVSIWRTENDMRSFVRWKPHVEIVKRYRAGAL